MKLNSMKTRQDVKLISNKVLIISVGFHIGLFILVVLIELV